MAQSGCKCFLRHPFWKWVVMNGLLDNDDDYSDYYDDDSDDDSLDNGFEEQDNDKQLTNSQLGQKFAHL